MMLAQLGRAARRALTAVNPAQPRAWGARNSSCGQENLAAVLCAVNDLRVEKRPMPEPQEGEVLLKMGSVGICGSDVHYLVDGRIGEYVLEGPMVLGHESSGTVEKLGPCVKSLKEGDRVAIEPGVPCRMCPYCKTGRYHLCPDIVFCSTPPTDGNMARYYVHTADFCHKLPDCISLEEGALLEPLSVAVHACRRAQLSCGARVLIVGAGPIGLATIPAARAYGATRIVITDLNTHRLEIAKQLGVDECVKVCEGMDEAQIASEVMCQLGGPAHVTIECVGTGSAITQGLLATQYGGVFVLVGMGTDNARLPLTPIFHEVRFSGSFRYANAYPIALSMMASGVADLKPIISHCFKLEEAQKAFDTVQCPEENPVKVLVQCNEKKSDGEEHAENKSQFHGKQESTDKSRRFLWPSGCRSGLHQPNQITCL